MTSPGVRRWHSRFVRRKFLVLSAIAITIISLLATGLPFNANSETASAADSVFYDFISSASSASWSSGAGSLPFPGRDDDDSRGFALYRNNAQLEDNSTVARALETHPQWVSSGWIMGRYPQLTIPSRAQLKTTVGFFKGASGTDGVTFQVQFEEGQNRQTILSQGATYDGSLDSMTTSLSSLAGRTGHFILYVNAGQNSGRDWAAWAEAKIETQAAAELPDLVTTDIRVEGDSIHYKIENQGDGSVVNPMGGTTPFCNALLIDGEMVAEDCVNIHEMLPGQWIDNIFDYNWQATQPQHLIEVCADWEHDVTESNEQNNCLERTFEAADTSPPIVTISHSPAEVTTIDEVTFTAQARDDSGIARMLVFINGEQVKKCTPGSEKTDAKGRKCWECSYTGGPYEEGELTYRAEAIDEYDNTGVSHEESIAVEGITFTPPPLHLEGCWFFISGTVHNFGYNPRTLRIKVCEAETIALSSSDPSLPPPPPITRCKEGGRVWHADVTQQFAGDLPGPDLDYYIGHLCAGEYIVAPVYQPGEDLCRWQGSWRTAKGQVVRIEDSGAEGFDFTFEPLDSNTPTACSIAAEPEHPRLGEAVVVTILAEDDGEIISIWEKRDTIHIDGSSHHGFWHSLTVTPGLEGSTAGAQFSLTDPRIMQATVTAKVCDIGGNSRMAQKVIYFGSCDDGIQNQGETGIDCGGPCPSRCMDCLSGLAIGTSPSAYLYSPDEMDYIEGWALGALSEFATEHHISSSELDTSDEYIEAISWWVSRHMGYRGDGINDTCLNDVLHLDYHPDDYGHGDFPQPAYYTLNYSGRPVCNGVTYEEDDTVKTWHADPSKWFYGDCEDFAILESALLRSLGVCHRCIFNGEAPGHGFNVVNYRSKYRILEPQSGGFVGAGYNPIYEINNLWNDRLGAFCCSDFDKVQPWEYTMNYPVCERPSVGVSGGGFAAKALWLDWDGWGENNEVVVGDFDNDGRDDIAAVWFDYERREFWASVFSSTGAGFQTPSQPLPDGWGDVIYAMTVRDSGGDYIVTFHGYLAGEPHIWCTFGTPRACPTCSGSKMYYRDDISGGAIRIGDPDGDGMPEVVEFCQGDNGDVTVNGNLWKTNFSPHEEIPFVGDFDGDGCDDIISFENGDWAGVRVSRSFPAANHFGAHLLWHRQFCPEGQRPLIGDLNGDGREDIISFDPDSGDVFVGLSTRFGFWSDGFGRTQAVWATGFYHEEETPLVGDFNGDGLDDIACLSVDDGRARIWVALTLPSTMTYDCHGGNLCEEAAFYIDAYWPSVCP